jgi:prepilin-type N-terminal cleavage/methylation domain-containing protein
MRLKKSKGFTITELIITVAIIGILAAIVVPMYTNHIRRARRSDAKVALENVRAMEEQFRAENGNWTLVRQDLVSFGWPSNAWGPMHRAFSERRRHATERGSSIRMAEQLGGSPSMPTEPGPPAARMTSGSDGLPVGDSLVRWGRGTIVQNGR